MLQSPFPKGTDVVGLERLQGICDVWTTPQAMLVLLKAGMSESPGRFKNPKARALPDESHRNLQRILSMGISKSCDPSLQAFLCILRVPEKKEECGLLPGNSRWQRLNLSRAVNPVFISRCCCLRL